MNEPKHIRDVVIRSLEAQIRVINVQIDDLIKKEAPWDEIERVMDTRDELMKILNELKLEQ